ncbi:MAG: hypothetical protein BWX87_00798 [Bacteroidetes bacterium ADurb.Bin123]|nr:MAG: hypothetical protein BWX87_00798 [Bacteroidetes bacterium ADurb.Bin123]
MPAQGNLLLWLADHMLKFRDKHNGLLYKSKPRFLSHDQKFKGETISNYEKSKVKVSS